MEKKQSGLVKLFLIIAVVIIILGALKIDLRGIVESETTRKNFRFIFDVLSTVWERFLKAPVLWLLDHIVRPFIFEPLKNILIK